MNIIVLSEDTCQAWVALAFSVLQAQGLVQDRQAAFLAATLNKDNEEVAKRC
jgi:hypothetical protein